MRDELEISSPKNPRIRTLIDLSHGKERQRTGLFALEGAREITRALASGYELAEIYVCAGTLSAAAATALQAASAARGWRKYNVTEPVFAKIAMRDSSDGLVAVFTQRSLQLADLQLPSAPLILAVQNLEKPGNFGALLRSADGAGADAVVFLDRAMDLYHPHVLRNSLGTVFNLQVVATSSEEFRTFCKQRDLNVYAAALTANAVNYASVNYAQPSVLLLGEEATGLSRDWLSSATACIKVPMLGLADSLNVAAAGAVLLYEARRQRGV